MHENKSKVRASEIAEYLGAKLEGPDAWVERVTALHEPRYHALSWSKHDATIDVSMVVIVDSRTVIDGRSVTTIVCDRPRLGMLKAVRRFFSDCVRPVFLHATACVHRTAVIGEPGLSYEKDKGEWLEFFHVGGVTVAAKVSIGAGTVVHRGVLDDTVIQEGTKIGSLCNIGHGVLVGQRVLIAPMTTIGGSARVGDDVTIWQHCTIKNGVTIGAGAVIGQHSNVLHDVPAGETWAGNPARKLC